MVEVVISPKYQVVIPKQIRKQLALRSGQKVELVVKAGLITLVPERPLREFRGYLKNMDTKGYRDHGERR